MDRALHLSGNIAVNLSSDVEYLENGGKKSVMLDSLILLYIKSL